jgi:hypothetical protein
VDARIYAPADSRRWGVKIVRRYLVVANRTFGDDQLLEKLRERMEAGPSHFHVLVPATRVDHALFEPPVLAQAAFQVTP